jgi:Macrocin-O-methyltransferase (TylF)
MWNVEIANHGSRIAAMPCEQLNGRSVRDGYLRGCGIQFGNIRKLCAADSVFARAHGLARSRSYAITDDNLCNLFLLIRFFLPSLPPGHIVEFGTDRGGSAIFMAIAAHAFCPGTKVFAFDSFAGMPETDPQRDVHKKGDFHLASEEDLRLFASRAGVGNLELVKGLFDETIPAVLPSIGPLRLSHIDCDLYDSVGMSYDGSKPQMVQGGYIVFDDPLLSSCLGAFEAVEKLVVRRDGLHAEQVFPHLVYRISV